MFSRQEKEPRSQLASNFEPAGANGPWNCLKIKLPPRQSNGVLSWRNASSRLASTRRSCSRLLFELLRMRSRPFVSAGELPFKLEMSSWPERAQDQAVQLAPGAYVTARSQR
jgi:hypothetical protein